ncbi:LysR family transcriptional regulator [Streptomyces rectiviolaceus]|uniref:helix-turn-helix domain-containing protein n=1 Tax=Streptomyces rectiviolaceus TaxID=332591 RepID=UPI00362E8956
MERQELETFLTLAEELHFGRTAERLLLSQARVSQTVKKLERKIGAPALRAHQPQGGNVPAGASVVRRSRAAASADGGRPRPRQGRGARRRG